jgi:hypothetical protein
MFLRPWHLPALDDHKGFAESLQLTGPQGQKLA